jgi:hypothetical protein
MTIGVKPWPRTLREVGTSRARTRRELRNAFGVIPAGATGTIRATNRWDDMTFTADPCGSCGMALSVGRIGKGCVELIGEALI